MSCGSCRHFRSGPPSVCECPIPQSISFGGAPRYVTASDCPDCPAFEDAAKLKAVEDQRDAALAALEARGRCRNCDGTGTVSFRCENDDGSWGPSRTKPCKCGGIDPSAILSARDARMKAEGKVEALEQLKERGHDPGYVNEEWVSMTDIQHWLEAARKEAAG